MVGYVFVLRHKITPKTYLGQIYPKLFFPPEPIISDKDYMSSKSDLSQNTFVIKILAGILGENVNKLVYICAMENLIKYKGIHPGIVLRRLLKKRLLKQRPLALSIGEHPQTLNAVTQGKRSLNTALALKIERELRLGEGTLAILQTYYDIRKEKEKRPSKTPNLSLLGKSLFWDTNINQINWEKQYRAVIERVFERGNETEKNEIRDFYGTKKVNAVLNSKSRKPYAVSNREI